MASGKVEVPQAARLVRWTGHPFVDAGLAAICAGVGVGRPEDLAPAHIVEAARRLERVLLSDQALGIGTERNFATGALSFVFPNSELVNQSNWKGDSGEGSVDRVREKFRDALAAELRDALRCLDLAVEGDEVCPICGERRPAQTMRELRKSHMPLAQGIVNFYPGFRVGMRTCGLCTFALRFLPLSTLSTGTRRLWILHSQANGLAISVSARYGWEHFDRAISGKTSIDFYRHGNTGRGAAAVVYLLFELLEQFGEAVRAAYERPHSTVAYLFVNDNREGYIEPLPIPSRLLQVLYRIRVHSRRAYLRFWHELLTLAPQGTDEYHQARERLVESIASRMLQGEPIIGGCFQDEPTKLLGGWAGHRFYLEGVRSMPKYQLALLERVGLAITGSSECKRWVAALRTAQPGDLYGLFLEMVRTGWLRHDEFYALLPPGETVAAGELRDILLAVIYEAIQCQDAGQPFPTLSEGEPPQLDEALSKVASIGKRIVEHLDNLPAWVGSLRTARSPSQIRRVYLRAVERGAMGFADFTFLTPLQDSSMTWQLRDYLLAFLFDVLRQQGIAIEGDELDEVKQE